MTTLTNDEKFTASFVFYYSFADMISKIPDREIRLQAYEMLFEYALFGTEPQIEHWAVDMVFSAVKPQIDANNKRRKNGKKGGRKPAQEKATQTQSEVQAQLAVQAQPTAEAETVAQVEAAARAQAESAIQIEQARQEVPIMQAEPVIQAQPMRPAVQPTPAVQAQPEAAVQVESAIQMEQARQEAPTMQVEPVMQAQPVQPAVLLTPAVQAQPAATAKDEAAAQAEAAAQTQQTAPTQPQQQPENPSIKNQQQKIIYFGENQYPTTLEELQKFEALGRKLFGQYHHNSALSPTDLERVLERTYIRIVRPDGQAIAAFDRDKADLLEYAFEQAQSAGKLDWNYLDGMYRNFATRDRTRSFSV